MPELPSITWFDSRAAYESVVLPGLADRRALERQLALEDRRAGYCLACRADVTFTVPSGNFFADAPDLREGWTCERCHCTNRQRLLLHAVRETLGRAPGRRSPRVYLAEAFSRLAMQAVHEPWRLEVSDYVDPALASGTRTSVHGHPVTHQDLTATTLRSGRFDAVVHAEVLEHVPDWRAVLRETARLTRRGGWTIFTAPFRADRDETLVRAVETPSGTCHLLQPEIHGAPLNPDGVLVYQVPGWDLLSQLRESGFQQADIGWFNSVRHGVTSNNSGYDNYLEPLVFRARR